MPFSFWFNANGNVCVSSGKPIYCESAPCYEEFVGGFRVEFDTEATGSEYNRVIGGFRVEFDHTGLAGP